VNAIFAQGSLSGKIVDAENKPVDYFNMVLSVPGDSSVITSAAFTNGTFTFKNLTAKKYVLKITSFGFAALKQTIEVNGNNTVLPTIVLQPITMKEVTVTARRPTIQSKADRTIVSVEGSILANALNGNDMLQKTPGLIRDPNGELIVAGKGAPKYYIDGKEVYSMNEVKILNPQNIKSIEIIDNPSAAYDAEGHAVVLIHTLKQMDHYLLRVGGDFTQSRESSGSGFAEGTLKTGIVTTNLYLDHSINNKKTFENNYSELPSNNTMDTHAYNIFNDLENSYRLSLNIDITKSQTLILQSNGYSDNSMGIRNQLSNFTSLAMSDFNTHMNESGKSWQCNSTINYNYKIDTLGQNLKVIADYTIGNNQNTNKFYNQLVGEENNTPFWNDNQSNGMPAIYSIKGDYAKPLGKKTTLEAGLKYYWIKSDNVTNLTGSTNLYQHYVTVEQNLAAYASLTVKLTEKLEFRAGMRVEQTLRKARKDDVAYMDTTQLGLFPSALINYTYSDNFSAGISYSKRISRPSFSALDPSLYVDSLTNRKGNPNLQSTDIHSVQLSFKLFSILSLRAGYNYSIHPIYILVYKDNLQPQLTDVRFVNGDNIGRFTASVSFNKQLFNWWSTTVYGAFFTNSYPYYDENNIKRNNDTPGKNVTFQNSISLPKKFVFDIGYQYNGKGSSSCIYYEPYWNLYCSLQRSFFHQALTCTFTANDLFNQMITHQHSVLSGQNLNVFDQDDRTVGISIKYQIGKSKYNYSSKSENSEERQRLR
jgi:hypothetical protein